MLISLFPTPFGHFQFLGSAGQNPKLILTLCHTMIMYSSLLQTVGTPTYFCISISRNNPTSTLLRTDNCNSRWSFKILLHSFLLQIYCRLLQPKVVSASLRFQQKKCSFYRFLNLLISGDHSNQKGIKSPTASLLNSSAAKQEPSGTVQYEHAVARSNYPTAESKLFPTPRPLVGKPLPPPAVACR